MVLPLAHAAIGPHKIADCCLKELNSHFWLGNSVFVIIVSERPVHEESASSAIPLKPHQSTEIQGPCAFLWDKVASFSTAQPQSHNASRPIKMRGWISLLHS